MPVSKHIAGLTALALQDRILTYNERQVIVKEAVKEGTSLVVLLTWLTSLTLLIVSISMVKKNKNTDPPSKIADDKFFAALHRKEMYRNKISTIYGDNNNTRHTYALIITDKDGKFAPLCPKFVFSNTDTQISSEKILLEPLRILLFLRDHQQELRYKIEKLK